MPDQRIDIGLAQDLELIRALAGRLGEDANVVCWDEFAATLDDLSPMQARQLRDQLRLEISNKGDKAMTSTRPEMSSAVNKLDTEAASSNLYWSFGGKENREVFNIQTTVRGILTEAECEAHVGTTMKMMAAIVRHGGHAKPVGQQAPAMTVNQPATANGHSGEPWEISSKKGRMVVQINWGDPPKQIDCPLHHKPMKYGENDRGKSYFHKHNEEWCRANVETAD